VIALAFLPPLSPVARLFERFLPNPVQAADPSRPLYLDEAAIGLRQSRSAVRCKRRLDD
jgi:phosphate:Na+ symporter